MQLLSSPLHRLLLVLLFASLLLGGCRSEVKTGSSGGRIDPYQTTGSDRRSASASIPELLAFTDQAAQQLAAELVADPRVRDREGLLVLELGTIDNQTRTPTNDFRQIQRRLRSTLQQSPHIRGRFVVVESLQRMDEEAARVTRAGAPTDDYEPNRIYVLQGDFYESLRGNRSQYFFNFKVTHLTSREIIIDSSYDLGQVRN
jgi:hypothetical protein